MTEVVYHGLVHVCEDPECHVAGYVQTLEVIDADSVQAPDE